MHQLLQNYFDKNGIETIEKRNKFLISLGLYEIEYSTDAQSDEYPFWDAEESKYYKKVSIDVTDEEYQQILQCEKSKNPKESKISNIFKVIATLIFIGGFIAGMVLGRVPDELFKSLYEFSFTIAITYWFTSFITGMFFLGFAEIIQLLTDIKNK